MKGVLKMFQTVLLLSSLCVLVRSSGIEHGHIAPIAPIANAPVVTAASSQYFERTFNRLVVPQVVAPVAPVAPPPLQPIFPVAATPVAPAPPVFVEPARTVPAAVTPPQEAPGQPNVAIAVATAHAAAPVATILLPPYPFGFPPTIGFVPPEQPVNVPDENRKEPTTQSTTQAEVTTTTQEPEATTPIPSSSDDNFVQALPSNENVNFNQYGPPPPPQSRPQFQPQPQQPRPQFQPQPQQPRPQFQPQPQQPRPQFQPQPQQPRPQFQPQPQQPRPQFQPQPQQPGPQFQSQPQQPHPQYQPQPQEPRPQYQPQPQQPRPQFQPQQPHPQYQPVPRPQFQPRPQQPWPQNKVKPQKLKTSIEVVPVPLAYIAPPPSGKLHHHHHHHGHVKVVKHVYSFVPVSSSKIILREVPARLVAYKSAGNVRANVRDVELTTYRPIPRPNTKPPRLW